MEVRSQEREKQVSAAASLEEPDGKALTGMIFDICRGSCTDGPGIRTTVYLKGCTMKCRWCHNPEGQYGGIQLMVYQNKCVDCGQCQRICPHHLESCEGCGLCAQTCPAGARKICGRIVTPEEVWKEIGRDEAFYRKSGGGVTFSGGECMLQIDFLEALLRKCKEHNIHTAVDTAGNVPWEGFARILPVTDLFLYDIKCITESLHIAGTGVSNRRILDNLKKLSEEGKEIQIRIPVIGGFNDDREEMMRIASFLKAIRHRGVDLLSYHKIGEDKYEALQMQKTSYNVPSREELQNYMRLFVKTEDPLAKSIYQS